MITREQKLDYARRNTAIFIEEHGTLTNHDEGSGKLIRFSFPLFQSYGQEYLTEDQLFRLSCLTIEFLDRYYPKATQFTHQWYYEQMKLMDLFALTKTDTKEEYRIALLTEVYHLFAKGGVLYEIDLYDSIYAIVSFILDRDEWTFPDLFRKDHAITCFGHLFLSALPMVEKSFDIHDRDDVDSQMEYLLKAFLFASGKEITDREFFEPDVA